MIGATRLAPLAILLVATSAYGDSEDARRLFVEGVELAKQEHWEDALRRFEASRALVERASTLFNIGTTLMNLGRPTAAIDAFERFLALAEPDQQTAGRTQLKRARKQVAHLQLKVEPTGATLLIDGRVITENGPVRKLRVDPGEHRVEVHADGFLPRQEVVAFRPGAKVVRTFALSPVKLPSPPPPLPVTPPVVDTKPPDDDGSILTNPWFWVVTGAVVVVLAVGVGVGVGLSGSAEPHGGTGDGVIVP